MMGAMGLGILVLLLLVVGVPLVLLGGGAAFLQRRGDADPEDTNDATAGETPREILDRRLANGDIDVGEYQRILSEIRNGGGV